MRLNDITREIIDTALHVHRLLGPGLLESVYLRVMEHELRKRGFRVETEVPIPLRWDGMLLEVGFRADLIVNDAVIVELKSVEVVLPVHKKQLLTYLRIADKRVGLLLNFGAELMRDGIFRVANGISDEHQ